MSIRDEMLRDFEAEKSKEYDSKCCGRNEEEAELNCALWAAKWMAEMIAEDFHPPKYPAHISTRIRQLAKELEGRNEK